MPPLGRRIAWSALVFAALAWLPLYVTEYHTHVFIISLYYVILAASWNLLAGYAGQFSLAHHTFAGIGAYTSGLLCLYAGVPILVGIGAGVIAAAVVGYGLGTLCLRMRAIYLALATWAFAESVRLLVTVEYPITRGDLGLKTPLLFGTPQPTPYYYLFLGLTLVSLLVIWQIVHSRIGAYLRSIRDDEEAAAVMGLDTFKWKRVAFVVSAAFAAVAGGFEGHYIGLLSPTPMKFNEMAIIIIMVITGGFRTFSGPVVGAVFIEILSEELRAWGEIRMVLFAVFVLAIARAYPAGLVGLGAAAARRLTFAVPRLAPLFASRRPED
jgi:branched-chain amino acid transport system permease protein